MRKFKRLALGGTFDRLHHGHHHLLNTALAFGESLIIGITTDRFPHHKEAQDLIFPFHQRLQELQKYVHSQNATQSVQLIPLHDPYGPTITDPAIDGLLVTDVTYEGGIAINHKRNALKLHPLPIIKAELIKDSQGLYISSTRIRKGLVGRSGTVYAQTFIRPQVLSPSQRDRLRLPQGELIKQPLANHIRDRLTILTPPKIAVIGDVATSFFLKYHLPFHLAVFDRRIRRQDSTLASSLWPGRLPRYRTSNPAGSITPQLARSIGQALEHHQAAVDVTGEEDLAVLPALLTLPLASLIFYGQPEQGLVMLPVTETAKEKYYQLLKNP